MLFSTRLTWLPAKERGTRLGVCHLLINLIGWFRDDVEDEMLPVRKTRPETLSNLFFLVTSSLKNKNRVQSSDKKVNIKNKYNSKEKSPRRWGPEMLKK